jgi:CDP-6-deoxy-D-xylo-4-hexulose-3-dehydrase
LDIVEATPHSDPSWFGFLVTVREDAPFSRNDIVSYLEGEKIQTRMLFAGNLTRHPCFDELRERQSGYRIVGDLRHTDELMDRAFWVGVYSGMTVAHLDYIIDQIADCCHSFGVR